MKSVRPDPTSPYLRVVAILGLAGFALLCVFMWHSSRPMSWEKPINTAVRHVPMPFRSFWISIYAPLPFVLLSAALACVAAATGRRRLAVAGFAGCLAAVGCSEIVFKPLVDRVRTHDVGLYVTHIVRVGGQMFPSAHVTAGAAWAMFAWLVLDRRAWAAPLVLIPFAIGCSVMSQQLHYPADVIGGLLLGASLTYLVVDVALLATEPTTRATARQRIIAP